MSWQPATLNGIPIRCRVIRDGFAKAVARHEIPHADGAVTEDLGMHARTIRVTLIFSGDDYPRHADILAAIRLREPLEFEHPAYGGIMRVRTQTADISHDKRTRYCEVELSLVEDATHRIADTAIRPDIERQAEAVAVRILAEQEKTLADHLRALKLTVKGVDDAVNNAIARFDGIMLSLAAPARSITSLVNFGTALPGRLLSSVATTVEAAAEAHAAIRHAPAMYAASVDAGVAEIGAAVGGFGLDRGTETVIEKHTVAAGAVMQAVAVARLFAAEEDTRRASAASSDVRMDGTVVLPGSPPPGQEIDGAPAIVPVMTVTELERILAMTARNVQAAINRDRAFTPLKELFAALVEHVNTVKLSRDRLFTITVDRPEPLFIILHRHGLTPADASKVLALNPGIINPGRVSGEVVLYG